MTNLFFSGPVQSSHYEDSSDDDCDDGDAQGPRSSSGFRRQCSNIGKVENISKGIMDSIPSPSEKNSNYERERLHEV